MPLAAIAAMLAVNVPPPFGPDTDEFKLRYTLIGWSLILMVSLGVLILRLGLRTPAITGAGGSAIEAVRPKPTASAQFRAYTSSLANASRTGDQDQPADPPAEDEDPL